MSFPAMFVDCPFLIQLFSFLCVLLPAFGMACACGKCGEDGEEPEYTETEAKIAELAQAESRSEEKDWELVHLYALLASQKQEYDELDDALSAYDNAIGLLTKFSDLRTDDSKSRLFGELLSARGRLKAEEEDFDNALSDMAKAKEALTALAEKHDGDAMYEIACIQLMRGRIYHELGEYEKATEALDDAFLRFRALEKISDLSDTRLDMAIVSQAMASLCREIDEPLEKVVDLYDRTMRLLVELIDIGQMEHEQFLAETLIDKCTARFEAYMRQEFSSDAERREKFDAVLLDIERGVSILRRLAEQEDAPYYLYPALMVQGAMLLELGQAEKALKIFDELLAMHGDEEQFEEIDELYQYATVLENRGIALFQLNRNEESLEAFDKASSLLHCLDGEELDEEERFDYAVALISIMLNRSEIFQAKGDKEAVRRDIEEAKKLVEPFAKNFPDEVKDILAQIDSILAAST